MQTPDSIVWYYPLRAKSGNYTRLCLESGKLFDLPLRRRKDTDAPSGFVTGVR